MLFVAEIQSLSKMSITQIEQIEQLTKQGENSVVEFKTSEVRPESLAREIVSFANSSGGTILIGVEDSGKITGVDQHQTETWVANIVRNNVIPAIAPQITEWELSRKKMLAIEVSRGLDKPYQTLDGKFWIRVGSTNRMATKEELSRLFQQAGLVHFDVAPLEQTSITDRTEGVNFVSWIDAFRWIPQREALRYIMLLSRAGQVLQSR